MKLTAEGLVLAVCFAWSPAVLGQEKAPTATEVQFFESRIRPVLVEHCYACHSAEQKKARGGLQLDTRAGVREGGDSGPAVIVSNPKDSLLVKALRHDGDLKMPSAQKKLPDNVIADFEAWVRLGAPDPRDGAKSSDVIKGIDYAQGRKHWAYQPVRTPAIPEVQNQAWPHNPIDHFILAKIEAKKLKPADDAKGHVLLRRLSFDLTGLPPTPDELLQFEKAAAVDPRKAIDDAVDRLLASEQFGVHWGRHWLDGVRFNPGIESTDFYRQWVIKALNADLPYDQFVQRQIAGDLLPHSSDADHDDSLVATLMLCLNGKEMDAVEGVIEVVGQQILGVSINCAKCHDHKYDAYSQDDYYALAGIFTSTSFTGKVKSGATPPRYPLRALKGVSVFAAHEGTPGDTNLLLKGDPKQKAGKVPRHFPAVLAGDAQQPLGEVTRQSGRLELARWLTEPSNPLTARVMANRVWLRLLGKGIVDTPNDFGVKGDPPTHPELLDYLAHRFVQSGWSTKGLIREIVLSRTYQQASRAAKEIRAADLENELYTRVPRRRLQYEQIVDSLSSVGDRLDLTPGPVGLSAKEKIKLGRFPEPTEKWRRTIYGGDVKTEDIFDGASPELLTERREASVTGPQMLFFLNNPRVLVIADAVARRVEKMAASADAAAKIHAAYRLLYARNASGAEIAEGEQYLRGNSLARYCHALMSANEFVYLD